MYSKSLIKYFEFDLILKYYKQNNRHMYFEFPVESTVDRFVFYFLINTQNDKDEILKLFENINLNQKCLNIFKKIEICENGSLFAVGFNYNKKTQILNRTTLYSKFNEFSSEKEKENEIFLKKYFNLNLKSNKDCLKIKNYGIDVFCDNIEVIKVYFEKSRFVYNIKEYNSELNNVLEHKLCSICYKYYKNELVDEKYEFSINIFSEKEIKILQKNNICDKSTKLFSIYFDKLGNVKKNVKYNI